MRREVVASTIAENTWKSKHYSTLIVTLNKICGMEESAAHSGKERANRINDDDVNRNNM